MFAGTTFFRYWHKGILLSMGSVLEAASYIYVTIFWVTIFKEKMNKQKMTALILIVAGIVAYAVCG